MKIAILAVPARLALVDGQLPYLPNAKVWVDTDYNGVLWNSERVFADGVTDPEGLLLIQDDAVVPCWFMEEFEKSKIQNRPMSYFYFGKSLAALYRQGICYVQTNNITGQANYYPQWFLRSYFEWIKLVPPAMLRSGQKMSKEEHYRNWSTMDISINLCLRWLRQFSFLTVPNLVDHRRTSSTLGHNWMNGRVSFCFGKSLLRKWDASAIGNVKYSPDSRLNMMDGIARTPEADKILADAGITDTYD
jgi:hypothetical protein